MGSAFNPVGSSVGRDWMRYRLKIAPIKKRRHKKMSQKVRQLSPGPVAARGRVSFAQALTARLELSRRGHSPVENSNGLILWEGRHGPATLQHSETIMRYRTFYFLKMTALLCAVPFVSVADARMLLLVAVGSGIAAVLFHKIEA